jgi:hypothetical protein
MPPENYERSGDLLMLKNIVNHISSRIDVEDYIARKALGIVLNAADRQGSQFAEFLFEKVPGARTLSAQSGAEIGAATGIIARLIEQTPGGRSAVAFQMIRDLQEAGLGTDQISEVLPSIGSFAQENLGYQGKGHLGDFLGANEALETSSAA